MELDLGVTYQEVLDFNPQAMEYDLNFVII